ncbi:TAP C-terminal (TAP-C) domain [Ceraceosorus bombacis]|uniref:TAP C-terminal (TAP-C) domain n=1 Tax=Ceraceosorus bombacis TaxID=401625 RepID=A0A0P1BN55_9BASI|nr:TAP C-terminal (TAP-C) domain [Ceraceosorus bombacis]
MEQMNWDLCVFMQNFSDCAARNDSPCSAQEELGGWEPDRKDGNWWQRSHVSSASIVELTSHITLQSRMAVLQSRVIDWKMEHTAA